MLQDLLMAVVFCECAATSPLLARSFRRTLLFGHSLAGCAGDAEADAYLARLRGVFTALYWMATVLA